MQRFHRFGTLLVFAACLASLPLTAEPVHDAALDGTWTFAALNEFPARAFEVVPGAKMEFLGEADPRKRADLIAYLRALSDDPPPLP